MSYWYRRLGLSLVAAGALLTVGCSSSGSYVGYSVYSGYGYPYYGNGYGYYDYDHDHDDFEDARNRLKNRDRNYSGGNIGRPATRPSGASYGGGAGAFRGAGGMHRGGGGFRGGRGGGGRR